MKLMFLLHIIWYFKSLKYKLDPRDTSVQLMYGNLPFGHLPNELFVAETWLNHYNLLLLERLKHYYFFKKRTWDFGLVFHKFSLFFPYKIMEIFQSWLQFNSMRFYPFFAITVAQYEKLLMIYRGNFSFLKLSKFAPYFQVVRVISVCVSLLMFVCHMLTICHGLKNQWTTEN